LDEFCSGNEDFSASESEYGYGNHEIDDNVSKASIHGSHNREADSKWKMCGIYDPDFSKKPYTLAKSSKPPVGVCDFLSH
jgi:hypothetical protein